MRKSQLENIELGNKVKGYNSEEIFTLVAIPNANDKELKWTIESKGNKKLLSYNSFLKNYKLVEETEVAITTEEELSIEELEIEAEIMNNIHADVLSGLEVNTQDYIDLAQHLAIESGMDKGIMKDRIKDMIKEIVGDEPLVIEPNIAQVIKEDLKYISVSDMAAELGMTPQDARRILRKAAYQKPEKGWKFEIGSDEYISVLNTLKGIQEKRKDRA